MAFQGLSNLVESIQGSISYVSNLFKKDSSTLPYPAVSKALSTISPENWYQSFPYTFSVWVNGQPGQTAFQDFALPINPQELTQDETFAVVIQPTQGGTAVNHSGVRYKDLVISGTTGISPFRGAGGVRKTDGSAIFQATDLKHKSGWEVFQLLANWFRAYHDFKSSGTPDAKDAVLVFQNFKDGEFLIIEVPKFTKKRSAASPFLYNYVITARVIGNVQAVAKDKNALEFPASFDNFIQSSLDVLNVATGIFLRSQDILRQIEGTYDQSVLEPLRKMSLALKAFIGIPLTAYDMGRKAAKDTMTAADTFDIMSFIENHFNDQKNAGTLDSRLNSVVFPVDLKKTVSSVGPEFLFTLPGDSLQAIPASVLPTKTQTAIASDQMNAVNLPRTFYDDLKVNLTRIQDNAEDFFNLNDATYDALFQRTPTLLGEQQKSVSDQEFELLYAFDQAIEAINLLLSSNTLFKSTYPERIAQVNSVFDNQVAYVAEPAVKQIKLPGQTSLERLALDELGDETRWVEIAELNNLKPPYISQDIRDSREFIKRVGDSIMLPQPKIFGFSNVPINRQSYITQNLSELEKSLGIDLKLGKDFDLELNNRGDLNLIVGTDNAAQALLLKIAYEKGDLIDHPQIGVGLVIGDKAPSVMSVKTDLIRTWTQDPRFEKISNLEIRRQGGSYRLRASLKLKNVDIPIPIDIKI